MIIIIIIIKPWQVNRGFDHPAVARPDEGGCKFVRLVEKGQNEVADTGEETI